MPEPQLEIFTCDCGAQAFLLETNGSVRCYSCKKVAPELRVINTDDDTQDPTPYE